MARACRFTISGRVQGVFFRESTRRVAATLGLTGYAINLATGDVEVLACGDTESIGKLGAYLQEGPTMAVVTNVTSEWVEVERREGFVTG